MGVVNRLARRGELERGSARYGKAFENWVFHELSAFISYRYLDLGEQAAVFWRMLPHGLSTGDPVASEVFPLIEP